LFPTLPGASNLASDQCFQLAKTWIEECTQHENCQVKSQEHQLGSLPIGTNPVALSRIPRHLIDISHPQCPRVVIHHSLPQEAKYVALSYVWGINQTYVLTKSTLEEKCSGLDLSLLPKTIIDAIEVTRRLGYMYLWVDALCIVQDAGEDMKDEIAVMGTIYRNSAVTIIAANALSSVEGFLRVTESPNFFVDPFDIPIMTKHGTVEYLSVGYRSYYKPSRDPINTRAWTLQERILSTRNLVYSYDGLKWSCQTCERNPSGPPDAPLMFPRTLPQGNLGESSGMASNDELRQAWLDIRSEYTSRKLTYGGDKLAAISAIAFDIAKESGWTYLAGLWKEHLFLDLQWHRDPQSTMSRPEKDDPTNPLHPRSTEYRAPSWSWASMDGPVVDPNEGGDPRSEFHFQILSCEIEYQNITAPAKFHFEPVRSGILVVEAPVIELNWRWADPGDLTDTFLLDPEQGISYICGEANFDAVEPDLEPETTKVSCLAMSMLTYEKRKMLPVEGLLIVREKEPETFRRVGFFKIYSTVMFDGVSARTVRIV
jgi:hypothetical protein